MSASADRNLLFGVLALQMDFVSRDALIAAMHAWVLDKDKALGEILVRQGALPPARYTLLEALVQEHLDQHDHDPQRSLAALSVRGSIRQDLEQVADPDMQASLAQVARSEQQRAPGSEDSLVSQAFPMHLDEVCDRFEDAWIEAREGGQRPGIEEYAQQCEESQRQALLQELIGVDVSHRKKQGEQPQPSDYRHLFTVPCEGWLARHVRRDGPDQEASQGEHTGPYGPPTPPGSRFHILRPHAEGGLGEVFVARDGELNREVALKEIRERYADEPDARARFLIEAEVTGRLEHPGIVPVYSLGTYANGRPFYAMRFIRGDSLKDAIERFHQAQPGRTPGEHALQLRALLGRFVDVCEAIAYAHSRGVLHRDLKPGNIIVGKYGETLVVDWGLAKIVGREEPETSEMPVKETLSGDLGLTRTGMLLGTPAYMSPEQAEGKLDQLGPASDVYSLGATLYCLLTGQSPFRGVPRAEIHGRVVRGDFPRPRQVKSEVPPALEAICLKAMALRPRERYASAKELAQDIERWQADEPVSAYREPLRAKLARWARRHPAALTGTMALVITSLVAFGVGSFLISREQQQKLDAQQQRVQAQVEGLLDANPQAVQALLANLESSQQELFAHLHEELNRPEPKDQPEDVRKRWQRHRTRAAVLLLSEEPARLSLVRQRLLALDVEPEEMLLLCHLLADHKEQLLDHLLERIHQEQDKGMLRAAVALARFAPEHREWSDPGRGSRIVDRLLRVKNPLHVAIWARGLEPIKEALIPALQVKFRDPEKPSQRQLAASVLVEYVRDDPKVLANLLMDADTQQFAMLFPRVEAHRDQAVTVLQEELALSPYSWEDPPLAAGWSQLPPAVVQEIETAQGLVEERFALCQTLPLERVQAVANSLKGAGYRLVRCRPYPRGEEGNVQVACVWRRDQRGWQMDLGLTQEQVQKRDQEWQQQGYLPIEVAGYLSREGNEQKARFVALWARASDKEEKAQLYLAVPAAEHKRTFAPWKEEGYFPSTLQAYRDADGLPRYCGIWRKGKVKPGKWTVSWDLPTARYREKLDDLERLPVDVSVVHLPRSNTPSKTPAERVAEAEQEVRARPGDGNALAHRALAYFRAGEDEKALADYSRLLPTWSPGYWYRAQLHARLGHAREARADVEQHRKVASDRDMLLYLELVVSAWLGEEQKAAQQLEKVLQANPRDVDLLYDAARAYALAGEAQGSLAGRTRLAASLGSWSLAVQGQPWLLPVQASHFAHKALEWEEHRQQYRARALALLTRAVQQGYCDFGQLADDPDLASLRQEPAFAVLLARGQLNLRYALVSRENPSWLLSQVHGLDVVAHRQRCLALASQGYRPVALSVAPTSKGERLVAASLWHRPLLGDQERDRLGQRQANASAALLRLQQAKAVWPELRYGPWPDTRTHLIHRVAPLEVKASVLVKRLREEHDPGIQQALILALGAYSEQELPASERAPIKELLLRWYREHPDPGVHGAIDWLLRQGKDGAKDHPLDWQGARDLVAIEKELRGKPPAPGQRWYINRQGQTLVLVDASEEFLMGSPVDEEKRFSRETLHRRLIGRRFAIASKEVTVAEFQRFRKAHREVSHTYTESYSPDLDGPQISVTWYEAAQYCRWLSEQEGIPEDQWCYPSIAEIEKCKEDSTPLRLPVDYLSRTGYRLPSEAEWEYACRANARTPYAYGSSREMLSQYAWYLQNSEERTWPCGQKKPNAFGLFDVHGNVWEWCQESYRNYQIEKGGIAVQDKEDIRDIKDSPYRVLRGGSFINHARNPRSAFRTNYRPTNRDGLVGLRPSRTYP